MENAVLFSDFDNTISLGDVLDSVIETFSRTGEWIAWQEEWREGRISTLDCLRQQVGNLDVDQATLLGFVRNAPIDPDFVRLQEWAASTGTGFSIVSDNFEPIVREILVARGVRVPPIYANALAFEGGRVVPSFPYRSPDCARCAHCKASHFARHPGRRIIYIGDGLSDICPAMRADVVYAKDSLAAYLAEQGRPFLPFTNLGDVVRSLSAGAPLARCAVLQ
jgi:2,3-diketo-5-methylthio-1-phosphopentane phosphatase